MPDLVELYHFEADRQRARYLRIAGRFAQKFGKRETEFFSTPGRTEIGGNHTDHNGGRVLAGAVNLDVISAASPRSDNNICLISEGYDDIEISLSDLKPAPEEREKSSSIVRGICARLAQLGYNIGGFDAYTASDVAMGSGLSSSAAFEVQIASILNHMYNGGGINPVLLAQIAQYAENEYYGKPCGLMDQATCAVGGLVQIDFKNTERPVVKKVNYDFENCGYATVIVFPGKGHDDADSEYDALEKEMKLVATTLGGYRLREFSKEILLQRIPELRTAVSDRAILRALHFYADDERVARQTACLENSDFDNFLKLVIDSGYSSWMLCQNVYSASDVCRQDLSIALAISEELLKGKGAWRIHGGGFGGTIQAFVPDSMAEEYMEKMDGVFGDGSSLKLTIRRQGTTKVDIDD